MFRLNRNRSLTVALALLLLALVGIGIYLVIRGAGGLTALEKQNLVQDKQVALAYLENHDTKTAVELFRALAGKVPNDPLPWRNVAVARVTALVDVAAVPEPSDVQSAREALAEMARQEGIDRDYHWLALNVAMAASDAEAAQKHSAALVELDPDSGAAWFSRFYSLQLDDLQALDQEALAALERACELRPENAWLRVEWLRTVGLMLIREASAAGKPAGGSTVSARQDDLTKQLTLARGTIEPFAPLIKTHTGADVLVLLDEAQQAIAAGDGSRLAQRLLAIGNLLLPHAAGDQRLVRPHPLERVATEFQFEQSVERQPIDDDPAIDVKFELRHRDRQPPGPELQAFFAATDGALDAALADFDLDGRLDVVVLLPAEVAVWSRGQTGETWQSIATSPVSGAQRLLVQDLDADFDETGMAVRLNPDGKQQAPDPADLRGICPTADVDIVAYGTTGVQLLENRYDTAARERSLKPVPAERLPAALPGVTALTAADLEADGDLDLAVAAEGKLHRWLNTGDWTFLSVASDARPNIRQLVALDFDRDVDIDLLVAAPGESGWLENLRHGQFRWRPFARDFPDLTQAHAIEAVDVDGNASWDLLGATADGLQLVTTLTPHPADIRQHQSTKSGEIAVAGLAAWDYDNDGRDDLLTWSPADATIARGTRDDTGQTSWLVAEPAFRTSQGATSASFGDLDADGDLDAIVVGKGGVEFVENSGGNQNHWIEIALQAQQIKGQQISPSGRVSPYGVGTLLELRAGERYQARVVRGQTTHFGIGQAERADVIRVLWLNGVPQNIIQPAANTFLCEQQLLNTSCPYLYAWNGEQFEFVTDLLWNAPLGLQLSAGVLAPPRDWEYLRVPGESLVAKDGQYVLQLTEELWEVAYFDQVRLIAVDHPADTAVYSNEKVGSAAMAEYKIHTAIQPRPPVAARNQSGRDLLPELAYADGQYAKVHDRKLRQGLVEGCYLELDLGDLTGARQITLFLTGWVFPASTSINVALSQGDEVAPPEPPSLLVPDGNGGWRVALPFMGFPGGKTKTIAIDLSDVVVRSDPRIRIATTMEFYWDQAFCTVDDPPAEVRTTELKLVSADLHERGYSQVEPDLEYGPEHFHYDKVSRVPKWPPMEGQLTRLGDVQPLLANRDDQLLVIAAGDEVTLKFQVPPEPLPKGWKRDFLFYSAGWEKDGNLLTVLGQSVEPLPFEAMTAYPWPADEPTPQSAAYQQYLRTYQTRQPSSRFWRAVQDGLPLPARR